jgi:hypothetical protein
MNIRKLAKYYNGSSIHGVTWHSNRRAGIRLVCAERIQHFNLKIEAIIKLGMWGMFWNLIQPWNLISETLSRILSNRKVVQPFELLGFRTLPIAITAQKSSIQNSGLGTKPRNQQPLVTRCWVEPVPHPLFLRKSRSSGNRTRDPCTCSKEFWPPDQRCGHFLHYII